MNEKNRFALVPRPPGTLEKVEPGAKRILSGMIADTLALARVDLDALVAEGKRIQRREGMTPEDIRAFDLFHRAAVAGHGEAQLLVHECYLYGHGVREDLAKTLEWFHKSAESGFAPAQVQLAEHYYHGEKDFVTAVKWYRKAAEQGNADAQCSLGSCYCDGEGVRQDYVEAVKWTRKAAEQGNAIAQKNLGVFYDEGHGVPQDFAEAARWYKKAAEQGNAGAQNDLGVCYETGQGVPQDYSEAVKLYQKAAENGDVNSVSNLHRLKAKINLDHYMTIMFAFSDLLAANAPLIGDCSLLPYPKKTILYAIAAVRDDYETERENTTNQTLRESYDRSIPGLSFLFTRLAHDWQEIEQEDKEAIAKLSRFDSFPDWALPLKLKYLDDERARDEALKAVHQVIADKVEREMRGADF